MPSELSVGRLFDGDTWHSNVRVAWHLGRITAVTPCDAGESPLPGVLAPGFVDIQVNGGGGVLFNTAREPDDLARMVSAHARLGTTSLLPTLITDSLEAMTRGIELAIEARRRGIPGIAGVHFEGPHISTVKRGAHPERHIRPLADRELDLYSREEVGVRLLTVAPEVVPPTRIRELVDSGVVVFLGHSNADTDTVSAALEAGASGFTHLFNAMSPLTARDPGMVGTALSHPDSWCGLILDGHHLHPLTARLALDCAGRRRMVLVSDAMPPVGTQQQEFTLLGDRVRRDSDRLVNEEGRLAGSVLDLGAAVRYATDRLGVEPEQALRMASLQPARAVGLDGDQGRIRPGGPADLVLLDDSLRVCRTWMAGQEVGHD
ncbi:N-acetylglucosamine-6-phosphate deacetylase [Wenzhouxiangella sp. AB-CW3]|uniref:N-acetylglucosamine-6-phosphate deacetylase n=1 Tax=Wenzhouxiangella sp. AB-CW3 TaxID=2771012 RepID=UPI00168AA045|nr:N-acetylglucosamine-6-phosphate deacetylase [Wenzhouxiangella sp. AB-CW3]QOC21761.1 N-acetylglucosamine-6-phosphate deacetylase [Wenzhouxiangella sp. AB-CW3]